MNTKQSQSYRDYITKRNESTKENKKARKDFEMKVAKECRTNPKAVWHYMKTTNRVASRVPNLRKPDGTFTSSDADIANTLNQQYSSVFTKEDTNNLPDSPLKNLITAELKNFEISEADVLKELQDLKPNKSPGVDGLHPRVLKELSAELDEPNHNLTEAEPGS